MSSNVISLIVLGGLLLFGAIIFLVSMKKNKQENTNKPKGVTSYAPPTAEGAYKKNPNTNVVREDIFKFMEFDRIEDNMIISQNGEKYTAVIRCKGINYYLMSEVEQLSVEEGFINFLNTLKYPIQLYVQAQNIDLKENISKYRENMKELIQEYDDLSADYSMAVNSLEATEEEIDEVEKNRNRALNVLEYGQDIIRYVEKLSLNKNMLQRNFYVLVSYYKSEITGASSFKEEELLDICYSELFTRVNNIMSGLSMSSVSGEILKSNDIAELLYSSYNRDDHNIIKVREALDSGFYRLYSTSEDAITKKHKRLLDSIRKEAEYKAVQALAKAVEEGNVVTEQDIEDTFEQESSKQALELIKKERIDEKIKDRAKKHVIDDYKEGKKKRMKEKDEVLQQQVAELATIGQEETKAETTNDTTDEVIVNLEQNNEEITKIDDIVDQNVEQEKITTESNDDSIV